MSSVRFIGTLATKFTVSERVHGRNSLVVANKIIVLEKKEGDNLQLPPIGTKGWKYYCVANFNL